MGWLKTFLLGVVAGGLFTLLLDRLGVLGSLRAVLVGLSCAGVVWFAGERGWLRRRERRDPLDPVNPPRED